MGSIGGVGETSARLVSALRNNHRVRGKRRNFQDRNNLRILITNTIVGDSTSVFLFYDFGPTTWLCGGEAHEIRSRWERMAQYSMIYRSRDIPYVVPWYHTMFVLSLVDSKSQV